MQNEIIKELLALHNYSLKLIHSVVDNSKFHAEETNYSDRNEPYEPSMFIYAFFVFNTFCNYDWTSESRPVEQQRNVKDGTKVNNFIDIVSRICQEDSRLLVHAYVRYIEGYLKNKNIHTVEPISWSNKQLEGIELKPTLPTGKEIFSWKKRNFINAFNSVFGGISNGSGIRDNLKEMEELIYMVRNNLFHGSKSFNFFENGQDKRFVIYAGILTAMNEVLIKNVAREVGIITR